MKTRVFFGFFLVLGLFLFAGCASTGQGPASPLSAVPPSPYLTGALPPPAECADGNCPPPTEALAPAPPPGLPPLPVAAPAAPSDLEARVTALEQRADKTDQRLDTLEQLVGAIRADLAVKKATRKKAAKKKCTGAGCGTATRVELNHPGQACWMLSPFQPGVTDLSDRQKKELDALLKVAEKKELTIETIVAYGDPKKAKAEADAEGAARAAAVRTHLESKGVSGVNAVDGGRPGTPGHGNRAGILGSY